MSDVLTGDMQTTAHEIDCAGHWRGPVRDWRAHLIMEHCQFEHCDQLAIGSVDFGFFTLPGRLAIGAPMGVCVGHFALINVDHVSIRVSPPMPGMESRP